MCIRNSRIIMSVSNPKTVSNARSVARGSRGRPAPGATLEGRVIPTSLVRPHFDKKQIQSSKNMGPDGPPTTQNHPTKNLTCFKYLAKFCEYFKRFRKFWWKRKYAPRAPKALATPLLQIGTSQSLKKWSFCYSSNVRKQWGREGLYHVIAYFEQPIKRLNLWHKNIL